ncbi:ATPase WRNIP1-like protein C26H5.02c [Yarrowia sp. C11]|nr:ATPase WRNIP1-like protein C26H5.02c [Yarrowia sp. E02]KAG5373208.1 ATPase WRNIP1-like protein C26H5.02c [Yarrowia sp. C11]
MVSCPVCGKSVDLARVNAHLDEGCPDEAPESTPNKSFLKRERRDKPDVETPKKKPCSKTVFSRRSPSESESDFTQRQRSTLGPKPEGRRLDFGTPTSAESSPAVFSTPAASKPAVNRESARHTPLPELCRPQTLDDIAGQKELLAVLRRFVAFGRIPSIIFWGPPGVGKTTLARIIAKTSGNRFVELSATQNNVADVKKVIDQANNEWKLLKRGTILFIDELHRFSKAQQDVLLPAVEKGDITLIGATTENPSFRLVGALTSRCRVLTLKKLSMNDIKEVVERSLVKYNDTADIPVVLSTEIVDYIAGIADGDVRSSLNILELVVSVCDLVEKTEDGKTEVISSDVKNEGEEEKAEKIEKTGSQTDPGSSSQPGSSSSSSSQPVSGSQTDSDIKTDSSSKTESVSPYRTTTLAEIKNVIKRTHVLYDKNGDNHYDAISAFHKSIRGSDPDATLFYLGKMLKSGEDPLYIARRMVRIASEDIGLADDSLLPLCTAAYTGIQQVGMPEGDCILAHAAVKLALAEKSVKVYKAWGMVKEALSDEHGLLAAEIPIHLRNAPTKLMKELGYGKAYKYNPRYLGGKVKQDYMPVGYESVKFMPDRHLGTEIDPELEEEHEHGIMDEEVIMDEETEAEYYGGVMI